MPTITLPGSDTVTSSIGFGCAGLMRTSTTKGRQLLLNTAFDEGIRHFDVARMYGLGKAESELAKCIKGRRDQVTITSKFGIEVNESSSRLTPVFNIARYIIKLVPSLRKLINNRTSSLYQERRFDSVSARASLEKSLSELKTDYIDFFLLHEPALSHLENTDTLEFLEKSKQAGLIKAYGIAGYTQDSLDICKNKPEFTGVLQVPNDMLEHQLDSFKDVHNGVRLTFSPFSNALEKILYFMRHEKEAKNEWSEKLGLDCSSASSITPLLLQYCLAANPQGIVICSSTNAARVKQMARVAGDMSVDIGMLNEFSKFVQNNIS